MSQKERGGTAQTTTNTSISATTSAAIAGAVTAGISGQCTKDSTGTIIITTTITSDAAGSCHCGFNTKARGLPPLSSTATTVLATNEPLHVQDPQNIPLPNLDCSSTEIKIVSSTPPALRERKELKNYYKKGRRKQDELLNSSNTYTHTTNNSNKTTFTSTITSNIKKTTQITTQTDSTNTTNLTAINAGDTHIVTHLWNNTNTKMEEFVFPIYNAPHHHTYKLSKLLITHTTH